MKFKTPSILILMFVNLVVPYYVFAADNQPIVYAVLFHSPNCPHCRHFIENDYPWYQQEYGEQFQLVMVDVTIAQGCALFQTAINTVPIPEDRLFVPMMIIGSQVLVGGNEINDKAPTLIQDGLAAGGIGLPSIPGLEVDTDLTAKNVATTTSSNISKEGIANIVAVILLLGLIFSALLTIVVGIQLLQSNNKQTIEWLAGNAGHRILWVIEIITIGIAFTLVIHETSNRFATLSAIITIASLVIALILAMTTVRRSANQLSSWSIPIIVIAGLAVATYLSYVEVGDETAACGVIGDCNTVQQSQYAKLFGILPIGLMGIGGYLLILLFWIGTQSTSKYISEIAQGGLLIIALIGVAFSSYLTFLEPFVIKATCTWCLTSAAIMLMILWLTFPSGWLAINHLRHSSHHKHTPKSYPH